MLGVNLSGAEFGRGNKYGYDYIYPSAKDFSFYAERGLETVRLPVKWERLQPELGDSLNDTELGRLKATLAAAEKYDVKVIIDLHNYGRYEGKVLGTKDVSNADFADFWKQMAEEVGNSKALFGYGLMNEPHHMGGPDVWSDAAQAAINAIRKVDTEHTVLVGGENWSSATYWWSNNRNLEVHDPSDKLLYEAHAYFDDNSSGTYDESYAGEGAHPNVGVGRLKSFTSWLEDRDAKGFIGEFAVPANDKRWLPVLDKFLTAMEENDLSGTYWGAGPWFGDYKLGLRNKDGSEKPQLNVLEKHVSTSGEIEMTNSTTSIRTLVKGVLDYTDVTSGINLDVSATDRPGFWPMIVNKIVGSNYDDRIVGNSWPGATIYAGDGNDTLLSAAIKTTFNGGDGDDTVEFTNARLAVYVDLTKNFSYRQEKFVSIENLIGSQWNDTLVGTSAANRLEGGLGHDYLDGKGGADTLVGGKGDDHYVVDNAGDVLIENANEGTDTVHSSVDWNLGLNFEHLILTGTAAIDGSGTGGNNSMTGNAGANTLYGFGGNDILNGGAGADTLVGGTGNDTYVVDNTGDIIIELAKEGTDLVYSSAKSYTLSANVENLTLKDAAVTGTGNELANSITGTSGNNSLYGMAGNDKLYGGAGNDALDGGTGDDFLTGGAGIDQLRGGEGRDRFIFSNGDTTVANPDHILDFTRGQDRIDLGPIDANTTKSGNQAFSFIGSNDFSHSAGQVRFETHDGYTMVQGDMNGDGAADFALVLDSFQQPLQTADFLL